MEPTFRMGPYTNRVSAKLQIAQIVVSETRRGVESGEGGYGKRCSCGVWLGRPRANVDGSGRCLYLLLTHYNARASN